MNRWLRRTVLLDLNLFLGVTAVADGVAFVIGWIKVRFELTGGKSVQ